MSKSDPLESFVKDVSNVLKNPMLLVGDEYVESMKEVNVNKLQFGDVISCFFGTYHYVALYFGTVDCKIIHNWPGSGVVIESRGTFTLPNQVFKLKWRQEEDRSIIVERIKECLAESRPYDVATWNSEHFIFYIHTGVKYSPSVEKSELGISPITLGMLTTNAGKFTRRRAR